MYAKQQSNSVVCITMQCSYDDRSEKCFLTLRRMPSFECSICLRAFNADKSLEHAVHLTCGHTFCRECLINFEPKICPYDRKLITGNVELLPKNFSIHDAMAEHMLASDPLGVAGSASLLLPADDLVIGDELGRGATSVVHRGTLKGRQASA